VRPDVHPAESSTPDGSLDGSSGLSIAATAAPHGLRLAGEVSNDDAERLASALAAADGHRGDLTLDFAGVTFVDSSGIEVIAQAASERSGRGRIVIRATSPWIRKVLALTGVDALPNVRLDRPPP
jgi:anti-anti-sigma factor